MGDATERNHQDTRLGIGNGRLYIDCDISIINIYISNSLTQHHKQVDRLRVPPVRADTNKNRKRLVVF